MPRLTPLRTLPLRTLDYVTARTTSFGEARGLDWLTYSPLQMLAYHRLAVADAPAVVAAMLEVFPEAQRLADIGAGSGAFASEAARQGREVVACEHSWGGRLAGWAQRVRVERFDLDATPPARLPAGIDLAYCFEVAEHCTAAQGDRLVPFLVGVAPAIVFTAARPGQGGLGHINEQEPGYWIARFTAAGASHRSDLTERLRQRFAARAVHAPWFVDNLMVFTGGAAAR